MRVPEAASIRSSRSTKRQASWRASCVPTVVLPEPMNPARATTDMVEARATLEVYRRQQKVESRSVAEPKTPGGNRRKSLAPRAVRCLIALEDADGAGKTGEFNFGETGADRAEQALGITRSGVADAVRVGLQKGFGAVVDVAGRSLCVQVERIGAGEADFHQAAAAAHAVDSGADEIAVEEDVAGHGRQVHAAQRRLQDLRPAADGAEIELAGALGTDERAARGVNDDVAGNFLQVNVAVDGDQVHVAQNLFNVNQTGLRLDLQLGLFRKGQLDVFGQIGSRSGGVQNLCADLDAIVGLLHLHADLAGGTGSGNHHFGILPRLHLDAAVRDVLNHHDRAPLDGEVLFELFSVGRKGERQQSQAAQKRSKNRKQGPVKCRTLTHLSSRSCRAPSSRPKFPPSAGRQWKGIRAPWGRWALPRGAFGTL